MAIPSIQLPDYYGGIQEAIKNGHRRGAESAARSYADTGDYDNAEKATAIYAPDASAAYGKMAETDYGKHVGTALANGDYKTAKNLAGAHGDASTVLKLTDRELEQSKEAAGRYAAAASTLFDLPPDQAAAAYTQLKARARAEALASLGDASYVDSWPDAFNPMFVKQKIAELHGVEKYTAQKMDERKQTETEKHNRADEGIGWANAHAAQTRAAAGGLQLDENGQVIEGSSSLEVSRYAKAANAATAVLQHNPTFKNIVGASAYLDRIEAAHKNPGSIGDQELLDAFTQLNTGGNRVTEAQVHLITGAGSFADSYNRWAGRLKAGGSLSPQQRAEILELSKEVYQNYQRSYRPLYDSASARLSAMGIPKQFWPIPSPDELSRSVGDQESVPDDSGDGQKMVAPVAGQPAIHPDGSAIPDGARAGPFVVVNGIWQAAQ